LVLDDNRRSSGRLKHRPSAPAWHPRQRLAPGVIVTDMSNFTKTEADRAPVMGMQLLKCIGDPDDVASVVEFLGFRCASHWITGDIIAVDGGSKL
jgi:NAD(P)-dependent dehydrogenase (short-subunit alcohol dehydrogenase family)